MNGVMAESMRDNGWRVEWRDLANLLGKMDPIMKDFTKMTKSMD